MRISLLSALAVALATNAVVASSWFGRTDLAYNKWHQTELERWLSDHNVPYPAPSDRKDLEDLVKKNWNNNVYTPYNSWDVKQLQNYLTSKGQQAKKGSEKNKDSLISQVKQSWTESEDQANKAYGSVKDWIFDSWSDSQLKSFLDRNGIPNPQPRNRDTLLAKARENYSSVSQKLGETAQYPGDWLYTSWSESDLKRWLDERGVPVPQPSSRDKLVATVRRNSRQAGLRAADASSSAAAAAASASQSLTDAVFDTWSDSQLKEWADKNGIKVPQGSKRNELLALARKHRAKLTGDSISAQGEQSLSSASSYVGAATSKAGNQYAKATDDAQLKAQYGSETAQSYVDWIKEKLGLAVGHAQKQGSSVAKGAEAYSSSGKKSASSATKSASKSAQKGGDAATESATKGSNRVQEAYQKATDYVKEEL